MAMFYLENTPHAKTKSGEHIATQNHFDYICREGKYEKLNQEREDLVYKSYGNMPEWASSPKEFWTQAEQHRRVNGRGYREVKLALQEEFSLEENVALVENFCKKFHISDSHAYTYAIHDKAAAFDKSHRNIHAHIMFDERVIEPKRPLGPDEYFKRYSEDKNGNPSGGYFKDRYFQDRQCILDMRKAWADMVNEKFQEKGMDIRISEKTLKAQYYDLKAEGKDEEAEYYNREPAPHMGKMYRNKKNSDMIDDYMQALEREIDDMADPETDFFFDPEEEEDKAEKQMEEASKAEQKMIIFAQDALMRRIAREIQQERKKEREEQNRIAAEQERQEEEKQPIVITVGDICVRMEEKAFEYKDAMAELNKEYKEMSKKVLTDNILRAQAERDVIGDGRTLKNQMISAQLAYKNMVRKTRGISRDDVQYETLMEDKRKAFILMGDAEKKHNQFLKDKNVRYDDIEARFKELKAEKNAIEKDANKIYKKMLFNKKNYELYRNKAKELRDSFPQDKIIYADWLPRMVDRRSRVDGKKPIRKLETVNYKGSTYFILNDKKSSLDPNRTEPVLAVRLGDFIQQGKAPCYELDIKLVDAKSSKGGTYKKIQVVDVKERPDTVRMYKERNYTPHKHDHTVDNNKNQPRYPARDSAVEKALGKAMESNLSSSAGRLIRLLPDEEEQKMKKYSEYEEVVEEMKSWDNSIKLGGRFGR